MSGRSHALESVPGLAELARRQSGVVDRRQLLDLGVTRHHVRRQVGALRWTVRGPHVVVLQTGPLSRTQEWWAATLHCGPAARLAGLTALEQAGLRGWNRDQVHVVVPVGLRIHAPAPILVHTTLHLDADDVGERACCPTTPVARSTIDAARWARSPREAGGVVLAVVQQRLTSAEELSACLDGFRKVKQQRAIRAAIEDAQNRHDSLAEADVGRLVVRSGLSRPRTQVVIDTPEGGRRVDLVVDLPDGRLLVIEVDGPHHAASDVRLADSAKDAAIIAGGNQVLRIPALAVREAEATVVAQLTAIRRAAEVLSRRPA
jgi:very-short-patch-repair endonuclease